MGVYRICKWGFEILWCEYIWVATSPCGGIRGPPPRKFINMKCSRMYLLTNPKQQSQDTQAKLHAVKVLNEYTQFILLNICITCSPRARRHLFNPECAYGCGIVFIIQFCDEFKNARLTRIFGWWVNLQFYFKEGYPLTFIIFLYFRTNSVLYLLSMVLRMSRL